MKTFEKKPKITMPPVRRGRIPVLPSFDPAAQSQRAQIRQVLRPPRVQAKLTIGQPNNIYEQEADRVAEQIMRMPESQVRRQIGPEEEEEETLQTKSLAKQITPLVQRQVQEEEEEEPVMSKGIFGRIPQIRNDLQMRLNQSRGGGQPLPEEVRGFMERRFGVDFSDVRVHTDGNAVQLSKELNAHAFTHGGDIYFGEGRYNPDKSSGKRLLSHELTHVLQQLTFSTNLLQRDVPVGTATKKKEDSEVDLGRKLWQRFPAGVTVAFYDRSDSTIAGRGKAWAAREDAIGPKHKPIVARNLEFGKAFPDSYDLKTTLPTLGMVLTSSVTKAGKPKDIQPLTGTGPSLIRLLAIFSHGTSSWLGIGKGITTRRAKSVIKAIAPALTTDVNVVLYACSTARSKSAKENWYRGTLKSGGATSLSSRIRDALIEEGAKKATVWGHTTVGHVTKNFALRIFYAAHGKGAAGEAYAGEFAFGVVDEVIALLEVLEEITNKGYNIKPDIQEKLKKEIYRLLSGGTLSLFYKCYAEANKKLNLRGVNLAEIAPVDPIGVADIIEKYWKNTFWPKHKPKLVNKIIKKFKLKKLP